MSVFYRAYVVQQRRKRQHVITSNWPRQAMGKQALGMADMNCQILMF